MDANLRRQTLADTLRRSAARVPDRICVACGATRWTYRELLAVSERLAAGLAAHGIKRGDKVAVLARNSHGFVALRYVARDLGVERRHERGRWKNNRAENSHQPTRRRGTQDAAVQEPRSAAEGVTRDGIAKQLGIGVASVYRVLKVGMGAPRDRRRVETPAGSP